MNMKKLLYVLLAALLLVSFSACADENTDNGNGFEDYKDQTVELTDWTDNRRNTFYFEAVDSESITITDFSSANPQPHTVYIPAYIDGRAVVGISEEAFANRAEIKEIVFPKASDYKDKVPAFTVADNAFRGCVTLESVSIPSYIVSIGENVFYGCESMATLTFEEGCALTEIPANAFGACASLSKVSIPAGIKTIGDAAFFGCSAMTELTIADGVTSIGKQAFQSCAALKSITAPATLTEVGAYAFAGCDSVELASVPTWIIEPLVKTNLVSVTLVAGDSIPASAFKSCDKLESITIACDLSSIGESAFVGCKSLRHIEIPATVTVIGRSMFKNCSSLTEIKIPSAVTSIGAAAFSGCSSLTAINIPATVTEIGDQAFASCYALASIEVEEANTVYHSVNGSLYNADMTALMQYAVGASVTEFEIPATVTEIKASAFAGCTALDKLVIPNSVTVIGKYAFDGCVNISDVTLPVAAIAAVAKDGLVNVTITDGTAIAEKAFADCVKLESVSLPDTITAIGDSAFAGCVNLLSIDLPENMTAIGNSVFSGCAALQTAAIPAGVTSIGEKAFNGCAALTAIALPEGVTSIGADAFRGCSAVTGIEIPKNVTAIGAGAFAECAALTSFTVAAENTAYAADNGSLYNKAITEILQYAIGKDETAVVLPETVTKIAAGAFLNAVKLQNLNLPATVTEIGADAFMGCINISDATVPTWALGKFATDSLVSLTVTEGEEIGANVLANSAKLESVIIPATVKSVAASAFAGCTAITHADIPAHAISALPKATLVSVTVNGGEAIPSGAFKACEALTTLSLAESITKIEKEAFSGCLLLENVTLHEGITEVGEDAFYECKSITEIALPATLTTLGETAFGRTAALSVITVAEGNEAYLAKENVLYSADGKTLILYAAGQKQIGFVIPETVTSVATNAFYGAANLVSIVVSANVEEINSAAFSGCTKLIDIKNLSALDIKPGRTNGNIASNTDKNLINIYNATEGASKVTVADGIVFFTSGDVVMVMGYTGEGTSIVLPETVTQIAAGAFVNVDFTEIVFAGTKEAWDSFELGKNWNGGLESYTIKCSDGDIVVVPVVEETPEETPEA